MTKITTEQKIIAIYNKKKDIISAIFYIYIQFKILYNKEKDVE